MTNEEWRPVVGFEGRYEVSDQGRVRSFCLRRSPGALRSLYQAKCGGYWMVGLSRNGKQITCHVHRLVMEAFIGPIPSGMEVRHLDGDPRNCRLSNLAFGSSAENKMDQVRHGTHYEATRTHCPSGHAYNAENVYSPPSRPRARYCRACHRDHEERRRQRLRASK